MKRARVLNGVTALFDVADDAVFIDHEGDAVGKEAGEAEDTVGLCDNLVSVAQQGKAGAGIVGKLAVSLLGIKADAQNLRAGGLEFGDIRLISLDLAGSTRSGGAGIESQDDGFLAVEVGKLDGFAVLIRQREVRSAVANLQLRRCTKQWHKEDTQSENRR